MGEKVKNVAGLFAESRTRVIVLVTVAVLLFAMVIGFLGFRHRTADSQAPDAQLAAAPQRIRSVPGALDPTEQYAKLQEKQNALQAEMAKKTGKSAIPTIIKIEKFGEGAQIQEPSDSVKGVGFSTLRREQEMAAQQSLWFQNLRDSHCDPAQLEIAKQQNASVTLLKAAGCDVKQLMAAGYNLAEFKAAGYSVCDLRKAGFSAKQLRAAGFGAREMRLCGFSACELKEAGFTAKELKDSGFSDDELRGAGFSNQELEQISGLPPGWTTDRLRKMNCNVEALKEARAQGVSASTIRRYAGCNAEALRLAGYTAKQLADAGFSAKELKDAGFSAKELKEAGFNAKALKDAGFSAKDLKNAGFSAKDLKDLGLNAQELKDAGFSAQELKDVGFTAAQLREAGFSAEDLRKAGFTARELKNAGFSDKQIRQAGYSVGALQVAGIEKEAPDTSDAGSDAQLERILAQRAKQVSDQRLQHDLMQRQSAMQAAIPLLMKDWEPSAQVYQAGQDEQQNKPGATPGVMESTNKENSISQAGEAPLVKAGDILYAVLDTSVNSDEPGPILATIVHGRFKGTKLVGSLAPLAAAGVVRPQKVVLSFNLMSMTSEGKSLSINAFAVDPNTARVALSSKTDNHTLYRYGSLLAASFVQGLGDAFKSQGSSSTQNNGSVTVSEPQRSNTQNMISALKPVGEKWSEQVQRNFERPPTIRVYSGVSIGILFTRDVLKQQS